MHPDFWRERWAQNQIGFHRPDVHPDLIARFEEWYAGGRRILEDPLHPRCRRQREPQGLRGTGHEDPVRVPSGHQFSKSAHILPDYIAKLLRAIVGVSLEVSAVEAKRKLSQNRPDGDAAGAADGLERRDHRQDAAVAEAMRRHYPGDGTAR